MYMNVHKVNLCIHQFQPAHPPGIRGAFDIFESGYCECTTTIGQLKWTKASQWTTGKVHLFVNKIYPGNCQVVKCPTYVLWGGGGAGLELTDTLACVAGVPFQVQER